jgi:hypothetical protein
MQSSGAFVHPAQIVGRGRFTRSQGSRDLTATPLTPHLYRKKAQIVGVNTVFGGLEVLQKTRLNFYVRKKRKNGRTKNTRVVVLKTNSQMAPHFSQ